ncbi:MAG: AzlC family ABC transporter permease [Solobacterium sp.]|jgi:4-azaleucine resistance transporter AzlC|nr:AzlC family ABC transporter permease [Solobacterium sp.]MCH4222326.1 AzlC family ABC transporter permease [Solobacterium sp.]MCH4265535.1 AzlC family ABC transporter permease [Solobacterium sp.]
MKSTKHIKLDALKAAFPHTLPIMAGFEFLAIAYGLMMNLKGFSFWYPFLTALVVYGGSLEYVIATMLVSPFAPLQVFLTALMIQARHLFYGIAMLDKYKGTGKKKWYLIFALCDETFSINCSTEIPEGIDHGWFYFWVTFLNQCWWVSGALIGGLLGSLLTFNTKGLDFVMTAMFVVIFLEQFLKEKSHLSAWIGFGAAIICLVLFGKDQFLIPTMCVILLLLTALRKPIEERSVERP